MAQRTLYPVQDPSTMDWSASTWALTDGGAADQAKPALGQADIIIFTLNSGAVTLDEDSETLGSLSMTGYDSTLTMGVFDIDVDACRTCMRLNDGCECQ